MSKKKTTLDNTSEEHDEYDEISDEDYGFVIGPDGELKSVFLPVEYTADIPDTVRQVFKIFGFNDADDIDGSATRH